MKLIGILIICCGLALSQEPIKKSKPPDKPVSIDVATKLKIRNLQFKQDKILLRIQRLQLELKDLDAQQKEITGTIESLVRQISQDQRANLDLLVFDLDALDFVYRQPMPDR